MGERKKIFRFDSEAAICAAFIAHADKRVWQAYPETGGFDILMVHKATGLQLGIEAKQSLNAEVVTQAVNHMRSGADSGPDFHAILVPEGGKQEYASLLELVGITTIRAYSEKAFRPHLPSDYDLKPLPQSSLYFYEGRTWFQVCPASCVKLPDYIPDVVAGAPSPITLTEWKVRAIKIAVLLERRGVVTKNDFAALKISMSRWTQTGWLKPVRRGAWKAGGMPDFRAQHPKNFDQIAADYPVWSAALPAPPADLLEERAA